MEQKIQAKFDLLPKYKRDEICDHFRLARSSRIVHAMIESNLPVFDSFFDPQVGFQAWLANKTNWLLLPFVWDAIDFYVLPTDKVRARQELANQIFTLLKRSYSDCRDLKARLLYANFSRLNLSGVTIWECDLTGADLSWAMSIKDTNLNLSTAVGADFTGIPDLEIAQLTSLDSLYETKFSIDAKKERPPEVKALERAIFQSYTDALYKKYFPEPEGIVQHGEVSEAEKTKREQIIMPLLQLIQLSGFSPLNWAARNEAFHKKFDALYKNHENVLAVLKQKIKDVTEKETGTYYQDRLKSPDLKAFWKPAPLAIRTTQIGQLYSVATEGLGENNLSMVVSQLALVKGEIKKEWNVWDSELLKKINQLVNETINEAVNPPVSSPSTSAQKS